MSSRLSSRTQAERNAATRAALLSAARMLFSAHGYAGVSAEQIVATAGVTRGALYHHFVDKRAVLAELVELIAAEVAREVEDAADRIADPVEALVQGSLAFVVSAQRADRRQIFLVDAIGVLGWRVWREIDARHAMRGLAEGLAAAAKSRGVTAPLDGLTHLVSGALNEAALLQASRAEGSGLCADIEESVRRLIAGLLASSVG